LSEKEIVEKAPLKKLMKLITDCKNTIYHSVITLQPFRACDESNFELSRFCNLDDETLPDPKIWSQAVKNEYTIQPQYIKNLTTSKRFITRNPFLFSNLDSQYEAYENDIAVVQVSILPTFYEQLLHSKIPKEQKYTDSLTVSCTYEI